MQIGELRKRLRDDLRATIEKIANDSTKSVYVLVRAYWQSVEPRVLVTKCFILRVKPLALIGCFLYYIDHRAGSIKEMYALPEDKPVPFVQLSEDGHEATHDFVKENNLQILN